MNKPKPYQPGQVADQGCVDQPKSWPPGTGSCMWIDQRKHCQLGAGKCRRDTYSSYANQEQVSWLILDVNQTLG